ncbi:MAG: TetR/AcrR family transcriptional regulator [Stenotrophobium sp.]
MKEKIAHLQHQLFLHTGMKLAARVGYENASLERIAATAKVPVARLKSQYVDFTHYLIALQQHFLNELRSAVIEATLGQPPGLDRVRAGTVSYLDICLKYRGARGWFMAARRNENLVAEGLRRQSQSYVLIMSTEFHALGWPYPLAAARLYLAAMYETARVEQLAGKPDKALRNAIWDVARVYTRTRRR